jgi:hypothetical protein
LHGGLFFCERGATSCRVHGIDVILRRFFVRRLSAKADR